MAKSLDKLLEEFERKSKKATSSSRNTWKGSPWDSEYNVDIHIWRTPGMGNSLQTTVGNKVSIYTALSSYIGNLIRKEVFTKEEILEMINNVLGEDEQ